MPALTPVLHGRVEAGVGVHGDVLQGRGLLRTLVQWGRCRRMLRSPDEITPTLLAAY